MRCTPLHKHSLTVRGVIGLAAASLILCAAPGCGKRAGDLEVVRKVKAARGDLRVTISSTGEVKPQNRVEIKPPVTGRVEEVLVKEGQTVTQGEVLAWMSSTERAALRAPSPSGPVWRTSRARLGRRPWQP